MDAIRCRVIVKLAATHTTDPEVGSWLERDERGSWEQKAAELLVQSAEQAAALGMTADAVNADVAKYVALLALSAAVRVRSRRQRNATHTAP